MERRLSEAEWLTGDSYSLADMALYAYTHRAALGGYDLSPFPGIGRWLKRVEFTAGSRAYRVAAVEAAIRSRGEDA